MCLWARRSSARPERQDRLEFGHAGCGSDLPSVSQQEDVANDFGLLLEPVALERPAGLEAIAITAEGVSHQHQIPAAAGLGLPDVGHFVQEQALQADRRIAIIVAPQIALRMHPEMTVGRHDRALRLEREPFAAMDADPVVIDRLAEDRRGKDALAGGERAVSGAHDSYR